MRHRPLNWKVLCFAVPFTSANIYEVPMMCHIEDTKYIRWVFPFEVQNSGGDTGKTIVTVHWGKFMIEACVENAVRAQRKGTQVGRLASQERLLG